MFIEFGSHTGHKSHEARPTVRCGNALLHTYAIRPTTSKTATLCFYNANNETAILEVASLIIGSDQQPPSSHPSQCLSNQSQSHQPTWHANLMLTLKGAFSLPNIVYIAQIHNYMQISPNPQVSIYKINC